MSERLLRVSGFAAAALLGLVAAGCAAFGNDNAALVALGLGLTALALAAFLAQRTLGRSAVVTSRRLDRLAERASSVTPAKGKDRPVTARDVAALAAQMRRLSGSVDAMPSQVVELQRRYDQLVTVEDPMPGFGSWAATPATVLGLLDIVLAEPARESVLECGSGTSTVWLAAAFRRRGHGRVVALEHEAAFAEETRRRLSVHGLSDWGTVLDAPLVETTTPDGVSRPWYDLDLAALPDRVDVLFVDGPPGNTSALARYPAFPLLAERLTEDALVVLDDTVRAEEQEIRDRWIEEVHAGRALRVSRVVGRTTFLQVVPVDASGP